MNIRARTAAILLAVILPCCLLLATPSLQGGADEKAASQKVKKTEKKVQAKKKRAKARGRLPFYYRNVVSPEQREEVYGIQREYAKELNGLRKALAELTAKRDAEIEAVLDEDQRAKVKSLRDEAAARRKKANNAPKKKRE